MKQFHACTNYAKVIKLPSHSSFIMLKFKREWREEWEWLTCFWKSRGGLQHSDFVLVCVWLSPSVFLLLWWWWRSRLTSWVLSGLQGAIEKTVMITLVFWASILAFSLFCFWLWCFLSLGFAGFLPSVSLCLCWVSSLWFSFLCSVISSFYKARTGGKGRLQWVSVAANGWNVSAFNGRAVAEEEDGEQSLQNDPVF